jgi:uncharacterized small protein (DUF1192 family)
VKSTSSDAQATATPKRLAKEGNVLAVAESEEVALGQEVIERLKSWCYV